MNEWEIVEKIANCLNSLKTQDFLDNFLNLMFWTNGSIPAHVQKGKEMNKTEEQQIINT